MTPWVRYRSTDATAVEVDAKTGKVSVIGYGEGAVAAWYSSQIVIASITSPWPNKLEEKDFAKYSERNLIDEKVNEQLQRLNLKPSEECRTPHT